VAPGPARGHPRDIRPSTSGSLNRRNCGDVRRERKFPSPHQCHGSGLTGATAASQHADNSYPVHRRLDVPVVGRPTLVGRRRFLLRLGVVARRRAVRRGVRLMRAVGHVNQGMSHHRPSNPAPQRRHSGCIGRSDRSRHHAANYRWTNQARGELHRDPGGRSNHHGLSRDRFGHFAFESEVSRDWSQLG
jgi:hypothetical protein